MHDARCRVRAATKTVGYSCTEKATWTQVLTFHEPSYSGGLSVAALLSVLVHVVLLLTLVPWVVRPLDSDADPIKKRVDAPQQELVVRTITQEELEAALAKIEEPEEKPELEKKEEEKEEPPEEVEKIEVPKDTQVVMQRNNDQTPTDAKYVADEANKTAEETRATETTMKDVLPGDTVPEDLEDASTTEMAYANVEGSDIPEDDPDGSRDPQPIALAKKQDPRPTPVERVAPTPSKEAADAEAPPEATEEREVGEGPFVIKEFSDSPVIKTPSERDKERANGDPGEQMAEQMRLFNVNQSRFNDVFGEQKPTTDMTTPRRKRQLFANHARRQKMMRASLENMISEVKPGNHTSVNANRAVYAGYLAALHRHIHARWANQYLIMLTQMMPMGHPLHDPKLQTTLEFVIDAKSGKFEAVNVVKSSGELSYDAEAIDIAWTIGDHPNPPPQIVSPNGKVYIHWNFWRDARQCGIFGSQVFIVNTNSEGRLDIEEAPRPR